MAMLSQRTTMFCRTFKGISSSKPIFSLNSCSGFLLQTASYNPKPLWLNLKDPYIPDKDSEDTPHWQKTKEYSKKLFGRYGSASGIDPASLWPTHNELEKIIAEEKEMHPPVEVMVNNVKTAEKVKAERQLAREKLIAENMAKMPQMVEEWRREREVAKEKMKEEKARRARLIEMARERIGQALDPRSERLLEVVAEIEKEEKAKKKQLKRKLREEQLAAVPAPPTPPAAAS